MGSSYMDFFPNANGNVLVGGFQAFANGGIVKGPTLGLVGEGRFNEAVVPLPDGRKIPVEMGKNMGGDVTSSVVVTINNSEMLNRPRREHKVISLLKVLRAQSRTLLCGKCVLAA